jgi:hypothetical protein
VRPDPARKKVAARAPVETGLHHPGNSTERKDAKGQYHSAAKPPLSFPLNMPNMLKQRLK